MERKQELLKIARQSKNRWINEGNQRDLNRVGDSSQDLARLRAEVGPVASMVDEVLELFTDIIADGETVDFASIIAVADIDMDTDESSEAEAAQTSGPQTALSYAQFLALLRHPLSKEVVNSMRQYVSKFEASLRSRGSACLVVRSEGEMCPLGEEIWSYKENLLSLMSDSPLWRPYTVPAARREEAAIHLERFLYRKLHVHLFGSAPGDSAADEQLRLRVQSLAFLRPEHLDLQSLFTGNDYIQLLRPAATELQAMTAATSPADMLAALRRATQSLSTELARLPRGRDAGADVFLPLMVLALVQANPSRLHSALSHLKRFSHPSRLLAESGYLLTYLVSAVQFLDTADARALTIAPGEFEQALARCRQTPPQRHAPARASEKGSTNSAAPVRSLVETAALVSRRKGDLREVIRHYSATEEVADTPYTLDDPSAVVELSDLDYLNVWLALNKD